MTLLSALKVPFRTFHPIRRLEFRLGIGILRVSRAVAGLEEVLFHPEAIV